MWINVNRSQLWIFSRMKPSLVVWKHSLYKTYKSQRVYKILKNGLVLLVSLLYFRLVPKGLMCSKHNILYYKITCIWWKDILNVRLFSAMKNVYLSMLNQANNHINQFRESNFLNTWISFSLCIIITIEIKCNMPQLLFKTVAPNPLTLVKLDTKLVQW